MGRGKSNQGRDEAREAGGRQAVMLVHASRPDRRLEGDWPPVWTSQWGRRGDARGRPRPADVSRQFARAGSAAVVVQRSVKRACRVRTVVELQSCSAEERGLEIGIWRGWDLARAGARAAAQKKSRRARAGLVLNLDAANAAPRPALGTLCDDCRCRQLSNRVATRSGGERER